MTYLSQPRRKGQSLDLNPEPSGSKGKFFLCHMFMGCFTGRMQHSGGQRSDLRDIALVLLIPRMCITTRNGGPPFTVP